MKYTKEYIARMRVASNLLEPPANEVVVELLDEISRLQEEARWISVSERLPKAKGEYLCCIGNEIFVSFYGDSWDGNLAFRSVIQPTHWRPLPASPESEG